MACDHIRSCFFPRLCFVFVVHGPVSYGRTFGASQDMVKGETDISQGLLTVVDNVLRYVLTVPRI